MFKFCVDVIVEFSSDGGGGSPQATDLIKTFPVYIKKNSLIIFSLTINIIKKSAVKKVYFSSEGKKMEMILKHASNPKPCKAIVR